MNNLLIFDIDNTLVASYGIYDEAYRLTSKELLPHEFIMTKNPDGTPDTTFSKMTNPEILANRMNQLGINAAEVDEKKFFKRFDENAKVAAEIADFVVFSGAVNFLNKLSKDNKLVVLTSGSKKLQTTVLRRAGMAEFIDVEQSLFLGDYKTKTEAIEKIFSKNSDAKIIAHFGDAPKDMVAIHDAKINATKLAVGVTVAGLTTVKELQDAKADLVIEAYNNKSLEKITLL